MGLRTCIIPLLCIDRLPKLKHCFSMGYIYIYIWGPEKNGRMKNMIRGYDHQIVQPHIQQFIQHPTAHWNRCKSTMCEAFSLGNSALPCWHVNFPYSHVYLWYYICTSSYTWSYHLQIYWVYLYICMILYITIVYFSNHIFTNICMNMTVTLYINI